MLVKLRNNFTYVLNYENLDKRAWNYSLIWLVTIHYHAYLSLLRHFGNFSHWLYKLSNGLEVKWKTDLPERSGWSCLRLKFCGNSSKAPSNPSSPVRALSYINSGSATGEEWTLMRVITTYEAKQYFNG